MEEHRVRQSGPVAVRAGDRIREPAQLTSGTAALRDPGAVPPILTLRAERVMVLAGTGRPPRSELRDMDLVDRVELGRSMAGQHTREPRREPSTDKNCPIDADRSLMQREEIKAVLHRIADRDHMGAKGQRLFCEQPMADRRGQDNNIRLRIGPATLAEGRHNRPYGSNDRFDMVGTRIVDHDVVNPTNGGQLAGGSCAHCTATR